MEREVRVEPEALRRVAGDVEAVRDDVESAVKLVTSADGDVGRRMAGWRLARVAENNTFAWRDDGREIRSRLEEYADALQRCARDYEHTDQISAEAFELFPQRW